MEPTPIRRRYTGKQKAAAVLAAANATIAAAADQSGIPESTIRYWFDSPKFADLRAKTDAERTEAFRTLALAAANRLAELVPTMEAKDLVILMGVAVDKGQLLGGGPTARTSSVTEGLDDHERHALKDAIAGALERAKT